MKELRKKLDQICNSNVVKKAKKKICTAILIGKLILNGVSCISEDCRFVGDAEIDRLARKYRTEFSVNVARSPVVQEIFAERGKGDVQAWFYNKLGGPVCLQPNLGWSGGAFHPGMNMISFSSLEVATAPMRRGEALWAHEKVHRATWVPILPLSSNRHRVGFLEYGPRERIREMDEFGFSEGLTCHFSAKFMGISLDGLQWIRMFGGGPNCHDILMVDELRRRLNCDKTLFGAFLFEPAKLKREFNRRSGSEQAWNNFIRAYGVWHRHNNQSGLADLPPSIWSWGGGSECEKKQAARKIERKNAMAVIETLSGLEHYRWTGVPPQRVAGKCEDGGLEKGYMDSRALQVYPQSGHLEWIPGATKKNTVQKMYSGKYRANQAKQSKAYRKPGQMKQPGVYK